MNLIKSISGIRGIYGKTIDRDIVTFYANIFSKIQPDGDILLARDSRPHGIEFYNSISKTLTSLGRKDIFVWKISTCF